MNLKHFPDSFYLRDGVYVPQEQDGTFGYSDGDDTEGRILSIVRSVTDVSLSSAELAAQISDWPSLYHLSPRRANLLRPFAAFLKGSVLEIGAGCGAITRYLGELGGEVVACEGSLRRAHIARERTRDLSNVQVLCCRAEELHTSELFDVVTLIGVLEYASLFGGPGAEGLLRAVRGLLKPTGVLILAIENQLGLKYFAGAPEDHLGIPYSGIDDYGNQPGVRTFGQQELSGLLTRTQLHQQRWFVPCPDYKFPSTVLDATRADAIALSGEFQPTGLLARSVSDDPQRIRAPHFSLERAWDVIARNGLWGQFGNSFLVAASSSPEPCCTLDGLGTLAWHYSKQSSHFCGQELRFVKTSEGVFVARSAGEGASPEAGPLAAISPYIKGKLWWQQLVEIVNREGWLTSEVTEWAQFWVTALLLKCACGDSPHDLIDERFSEATPLNLIVDQNGNGSFCIQERPSPGTVSVGSILVGGLVASFSRVTSVLPPGPGTPIHHGALVAAVLTGLGYPPESENFRAVFADTVGSVTSSFVVRKRSLPPYSETKVSSTGDKPFSVACTPPAILDPEIQANLLRPIIGEFAGTVAAVGHMDTPTLELVASSAAELHVIGPSHTHSDDRPNLRYYKNFDDFRQSSCTVDALIVLAPASDQLLSGTLTEQLHAWKSMLRQNGTLWIATDNRLFAQAFSLTSPGISVPSFCPSHSELERALHEVGFPSIETTLVFPSVHYPLSHIFPEGLTNAALELYPLISGVEPHIQWRSETKGIHPTELLRSLSREDLRVFAPAFLVRCRKTDSQAVAVETQPKLLAALYNPYRVPEFQKETLFVAEPTGAVSVIRRQRYPDCTPGVDLYQTITDEPYFQGSPWISILYSLLQTPGWALEMLVAWADKWRAALLTYAHLSAEDATWDTPLPAELLDGTPTNLIFSPDGAAHFFDLEWVPRAQPTLGAVLLRGLWYSIASVTTVAAPAERTNLRMGTLLQRLLLGMGYNVDPSQYESACAVDDWLQTRVTGAPPAAPLLERIESSVFTVSGNNESDVLMAADVSTAIRERDAEIFRLSHEITQASLTIAELTAQHSVQQMQATAHIGSLEAVAAAEGQERKRLQAELQQASEHILAMQAAQELQDDEATHHVQALETSLAESTQEVARLGLLLGDTSKTIRQQQFQLEQRDSTILSLQEEIHRVSEQVGSMHANQLLSQKTATSHITALEHSLGSSTTELARLNELLLEASHSLEKQYTEILTRDNTILALQAELARLSEFIQLQAAAVQERDHIAVQQITLLQQTIAERDRTILGRSIPQDPIIANSD